MVCLFESCESNRQTAKKNHENGIRFISFPTTDYTSEQMRKLAKKRLYWWCRICGVDFTTTLINQLHICSRHFIKDNCAPLWDVHNPDWLPSLFIPPQTREPVDASTIESCKEFLRHEQLTEESIANPLLDQRPDHSALRTLLIDEIIAYPIGRTYFLLDDESDHSTPSTYSARQLAKELKKCVSKSTPIGRMVLERNAPDCPERMFSSGSTVTQLDLSVPPRWEMEKTIMTLQHSVLELLNHLD
uniref:THAP-type domain-containing protein n=1 Tax=Anopheles quadriannulatus TaxID=34691 RepID=A0A182XL54_ANOQN